MTYSKSLAAWARLVRWPNLLIVALTQWVAWWTVIAPMGGLIVVLRTWNFVLLSLSTVLIAAAGYIINDYFDIRIDAINKPDKVILERLIPRRAAIKVHWLFNGLAMLMAAAVAVPAGHPEWLLLQVLCIGLLWRYSTTWKRQFMIGNVIVAMMTALTIVALIVYELSVRNIAFNMIPGWHTLVLSPQARQLLSHESVLAIFYPVEILSLFAVFAFLMTWMREIVKDMEDYKGDDAEGCVTMPIQWGLLRSSRFVQILGAICLVTLAGTAFNAFLLLEASGLILTGYIILALILPLSVWMYRLPQAATQAHYHKSSRQIKWIMVLGIILLLIIRFF
jgi:4-hydroxybenzoate polyprenyltransferase